MATGYNPLLRGAFELHCHSAPSIFARRQTDWELIEDMKSAGMAGALLKSHESLTASRAELIRSKEPDLKIYGGLACNYFTGGLSPYAVDAAIRLGAKCIWMPTISSQAHFAHFSCHETNLFESDRPLLQPRAGLTVYSDDGSILPEVLAILDLIAEADIMLATGHLSPKEVLAVTDSARERGVKKILIQHADMGIARIPMDMQLELASKGAMIEKCYLATGDDFNDLTIEEMAETIQRLGYENCVLVTDYGQAHNIPVVQALSNFIDEVTDAGVPESAVSQMVVDNPRKLLGL